MIRDAVTRGLQQHLKFIREGYIEAFKSEIKDPIGVVSVDTAIALHPVPRRNERLTMKENLC